MPADVGSRDWLTYAILHETLASATATRICRSELWAASSTTAWHIGVPSLLETHRHAPNQLEVWYDAGLTSE